MTISIAWLWRIEAWLRRRRYQVIEKYRGGTYYGRRFTDAR